jgi:DNA-binding Xre family transcriptional regulator
LLHGYSSISENIYETPPYPKLGYLLIQVNNLYWDFQGITMRKSIHTEKQKLLQVFLRELRLQKGLRQEDLAKRLGTPQSFVSKYEAGERRLDLLEVREICIALDISPVEFIGVLEKRLNGTE